MRDRPPKTRRGFWLLFMGAAAGVGFLVWLNHRPDQPPPALPPQASRPGPIRPPEQQPPPSESRYRNAGPEARYVGIDACAECHRGNHISYLLTAHSRALSDLDPHAEPPDGSFFHQ